MKIGSRARFYCRIGLPPIRFHPAGGDLGIRRTDLGLSVFQKDKLLREKSEGYNGERDPDPPNSSPSRSINMLVVDIRLVKSLSLRDNMTLKTTTRQSRSRIDFLLFLIKADRVFPHPAPGIVAEDHSEPRGHVLLV